MMRVVSVIAYTLFMVATFYLAFILAALIPWGAFLALQSFWRESHSIFLLTIAAAIYCIYYYRAHY